MQERVYAFTDESGAFGWNLDNENVSTHFIISAIIVEESKLDKLREQVERIRKMNFQTGEMKSSGIGKKHNRRLKIIKELLPLPFKIFSVVFDKRPLQKSIGLQYKTSFYKFMNNIVHKELRRAFPICTIVADEIGGSDYMKSFAKYVYEQQDIPNLWGKADFYFEQSNHEVLVQLADIISGALSFNYDLHKKAANLPNYVNILKDKIIRVEMFPKDYTTFQIDTAGIAKDYDIKIAKLCFKQACEFLNKNSDSYDEEVQAQITILKYLIFRFMNNDLRTYIPTHELKEQLKYTCYYNIKTQTFRTKIIGKLRDAGVIIAGSSGKKGYKIPAKIEELYDYVNHDLSIALPMMLRLKKCKDLIKLGTIGSVDLFNNEQIRTLKTYLDD